MRPDWESLSEADSICGIRHCNIKPSPITCLFFVGQFANNACVSVETKSLVYYQSRFLRLIANIFIIVIIPSKSLLKGCLELRSLWYKYFCELGGVGYACNNMFCRLSFRLRAVQILSSATQQPDTLTYGWLSSSTQGYLSLLLLYADESPHARSW